MGADNKCNNNDCSGNCESCDGNVTVTLTLDNDEQVECAILTIFPVNGRDYIALLPLNEEGGNDDGEVFIYRYDESNGTPTLGNIENDEEYEAVADAFDEMLDSAEYDELVSEEDLEEEASEQE